MDNSLAVTVEGKGGTITLAASDAILTRRLGAAALWRHVVLVKELRDRDLLSDIIAAGDARITARWQPANGPSVDLGLPSYVMRAEWVREEDYLLGLDSTITRVGEGACPGWRTPRWRVHNVRNFKALFQHFDEVVKIPDHSVGNALATITFADGAKTSILQCGLTDWEFVHMAARQYNRLCAHDDIKPLLITGSVDESNGNAGKWILTWGAKKPYVSLGQVDAHTMRFNEEDGFDRAHFGSGAEHCLHVKHPGESYANTGRARHGRPFAAAAWSSWRGIDAPLFTQSQALAWTVEDRIYDRQGSETPGWSTRYYLLPDDAVVQPPTAQKPQRACVALGKVVRSDGYGPWFDVRLDGFEKDDNQDLAHVRLTTPYSGEDEKSGLHFMAEPDTRLAVAWSGQFDESVLFFSNTRWDKAKLQSPSMWLDELWLTHLSGVTVKTNLDVHVDKETWIDSVRPLTLTADGARAHLKSKEFKTGRMGP